MSRAPLSVRRLAIVIVVALVVPIVPFLLLGEQFEQTLRDRLATTESAWSVAGFGALLLAADIVIPVPSSTVATLMGARSGALLGAAAATLGLSAGAWLGFEAARAFGLPLARRFATDDELVRVREWTARWGAMLVMLARGLPLLGEATVIGLGVSRMPRGRFLLAMVVSNAALMTVYATLGEWAANTGWLPIAVSVATAFPLLPILILTARRSSAQHAPAGRETPHDATAHRPDESIGN